MIRGNPISGNPHLLIMIVDNIFVGSTKYDVINCHHDHGTSYIVLCILRVLQIDPYGPSPCPKIPADDRGSESTIMLPLGTDPRLKPAKVVNFQNHKEVEDRLLVDPWPHHAAAPVVGPSSCDPRVQTGPFQECPRGASSDEIPLVKRLIYLQGGQPTRVPTFPNTCDAAEG